MKLKFHFLLMMSYFTDWIYDVIIRGAMLIDINSWKRSLQAYGIRTREI